MKVTKGQICRTAVELFRESDFNAVSVEDICVRCEVTRGSFYHHFKNKDDLLLFWFDDNATIMSPLINTSSQGDPKAQLCTYLQTYAKGISSLGHNLLFHTIVADGALKRGVFMPSEVPHREANISLSAEIQLVRGAQDNGSISREIAAEQLMMHYIWGVTGLIFQWKLSDGAFDFMDEIGHLIKTVFR